MIYLLTSVDTPPEKEGWYLANIKYCNGSQEMYYSPNNKAWYYDSSCLEISSSVANYFQRLPVNTIAISEEKLREVMGDVWSAAYNKTLEDSICEERGLVPDDFPDRETSITNAIKALKDGK